MSWPDRPVRFAAARSSLLVLSILLPLAGCGFHPLYGSAGAIGTTADTLAGIEVGIIPDRSGQLLRSYLTDRFQAFGSDRAPAYRLDVDLSERREELGIRGNDAASRVNLILTASFTLTDLGTGTPVLRDRAGVITSYSVLLDEFATLSGQRDARQRGLRQLGDDIQRQIALFFARGAGS